MKRGAADTFTPDTETRPMTNFITRTARGLGALALASCALAAQADTTDSSRSGQLASQIDLATLEFDVSTSSDLRIWTDSWQSGANFDPLLSLFDQGGQLLALGDDVDGPFPQVDAGQGMLDAGLLLTDLAAGHYSLVVSASPNYPLGGMLVDGFTFDTETPVAFGGAGRPGGQWSVRFSLSDAAPVPEPATLALMLAGLLSVGFAAQRRR